MRPNPWGSITLWVKLKAAVISAALTSIGGVFYAQYILFIEPYSEFSLDLSIQFALIPMIGGMGTASARSSVLSCSPPCRNFCAPGWGEDLRAYTWSSTESF